MVAIHIFSCDSLYYILFVHKRNQPIHYRSFHQSRVAKKLLNVVYIHMSVYFSKLRHDRAHLGWMYALLDLWWQNWSINSLQWDATEVRGILTISDCRMFLRPWICSSNYPNHLVRFVHLVGHMALHVWACCTSLATASLGWSPQLHPPHRIKKEHMDVQIAPVHCEQVPQ